MTEHKSEPIALFDLDGTLADFNGAMADGLKALEGPGESHNYENYSQDDEPDYMRNRRRVIKRQPGFWSNLPLLQSGFDVLTMCVSLGFDINVLTKGPDSQPAAWAEKFEWCKKNLCTVSPNISIVQNKGLHYGKVLVDDWPKYIVKWLEHRPRGLVVMPDQPYNRDFEHPQVIRYTGNNKIQVNEALTTMRKQCR